MCKKMNDGLKIENLSRQIFRAPEEGAFIRARVIQGPGESGGDQGPTVKDSGIFCNMYRIFMDWMEHVLTWFLRVKFILGLKTMPGPQRQRKYGRMRGGGQIQGPGVPTTAHV